MDRSPATLTNPVPSPLNRERRRRVRHRLHTPVYVSFNGPQSGMVLDLSELLDLSETGFCVQTAPPITDPPSNDLPSNDLANNEKPSADTLPSAIPSAEDQPAILSTIKPPTVKPQPADALEVNRALTLCLDLPETKAYVHGSGLVVWRDDSGRAGIRFSFLPDPARSVLKEWLFVNLLIACANHAARAEQRALYHKGESATDAALSSAAELTPLSAATPVQVARSASTTALALDRGQLLSALDEVRSQIREIEAQEIEARQIETKADGTDSVLQLITERAMTLTGATGCALALLTGEQMVCRARAGDPAPPIGSTVDVREGLSGECVRTGQAVLCEDTAADPRVDFELCRTLGLGSILAAPILADSGVVGLLEVFSPHVRNFSSDESEVLERLAELVPTSKTTRAELQEPEPQSDPQSHHAAKLRSDAELHPEFGSPHELELSHDPVSPRTAQPSRELEWWWRDSSLPPDPEPRPSASAATIPDVSVSTPAADASAAVDTSELILADTAQEPAQGTAHSEPFSLHNLREAFWNKREYVEQPADHESPRETSKSKFPAARSYVSHLALIMASLAAVALALGYLLAPAIERHLNREAQASESSPGSSASGQRTNIQGVGNQKTNTGKAQALTPDQLREQAEQGNAEAQFMLGTVYRNGEGVAQNDKQAVEWFQRAAEQGYVRALTALGSSYWAGRGVPQDYSQAYFWYELALAEGDQNSKPLLEGLSTQMTQAQVSTARQQAEAWLHAHNQPSKSAAN